jgi:hypothetical protein
MTYLAFLIVFWHGIPERARVRLVYEITGEDIIDSL